MIYFKVDIGYSDNEPNSMSDVTLTDVNKYLTIPFAFNGVNQASGVTLGEAQSAMELTFGDDYNTLYTTENFNSSDPSYITAQLSLELAPSYKLMFPRYSELLYSNSISFPNRLCIHFKSLNKLLVREIGSTPLYYRVYDILENGSLSLKLNNTQARIFTDTTSNTCIMYLKEYNSGIDLSNILNYGFCLASTFGSNSYRFIEYTSNNLAENILKALFDNSTKPDGEGLPNPPGPYDPGGESGEGTLPPGTFDDTSDPIQDSSLPTLSAADTGFTRIYNPTLAQVQALARYLWTDETVLDTIWNHIKQFFEDPMQAIIGFNLVPCKVPDGGTRSFALMYIDTGVQMTAAASQFVDVDCGTVQLDRYYGSALDQNPYTKVSCYLPYIGTVHLNTDEVMGTILQVKYRIDIVSGSCVAKVLVDGNVLYQYSGHCAITIPISSADFASYVSAAVAVGTAVAGLAVGAAAGMSVAATESEALTITSAEMSAPLTASEATSLIGGGGENGTTSTMASFNGINAANISNTVGQVMGSKMQVEHSGSFSGNSGYLGVRRPFLIIERPNMCLPATYGHLNGYPAMITMTLSECTGFTKVQQVQLTGVTATNTEQSEILQFLKSGVYL